MLEGISELVFFLFLCIQDGRKRTHTMEYIDSQVHINDKERNEAKNYLGQHIHAEFDVPMSAIEKSDSKEYKFESLMGSTPTYSKVNKREGQFVSLQRQTSDVTLNRHCNIPNKTITELKGRNQVLRIMKTANNKPIMEFKNSKFIQEMIAKRQERREIHKPISDFALKYGLIDKNGKKSKNSQPSEFM